MMVILGIDPGTHCGWCVLHEDGRIDSGTWNLKGGRFEGGGARFLRLRTYLCQTLDLAKPGLLVFEEVHNHKGTDAAHIYGGIVAVLTEECERRGLPYRGVPVQTAKKHATGKGNANKEAMMAAARSKWPGWAGDDNEADARWIATVAKDEMKGEAVKTAKEMFG